MDLNGKVIVVTNRKVHPGNTDLTLFGDDLNNPPEDLNLALAHKVSDEWRLELLTDPINPDYDTPVSRSSVRGDYRSNEGGCSQPGLGVFRARFQPVVGEESQRVSGDRLLRRECSDVFMAFESRSAGVLEKKPGSTRARRNAERSVIALA